MVNMNLDNLPGKIAWIVKEYEFVLRGTASPTPFLFTLNQNFDRLA